MLAGDLTTMPLAELLQWVDVRGARARVAVRTDEGISSWLVAEARYVTRAAAPLARGRLAADGTPEAPGPGLVALAREQLLDLFLAPSGTFELDEHAPPPAPGVALEVPVAFLLMEGLRLLDEWPRVAAKYPRETARLGATSGVPTGPLDPIDAAIRALADEAPTLAEARLVLGLSRPALLRRVDGLGAQGLVEVEGIPHGPDVEGALVREATKLLRARQFAEAAHVFRSISITSPGDRLVRRLLEEAERGQIEALRAKLQPTDVVSRAGSAAVALRGAEAIVVDALARPTTVAGLVVASPLRELETLAALTRLSARGIVAVEPAD
ncbi:MAG: DUF4388 domain-containing protein [Sandaracinaceae bacterium]|nr:DUF4388 domain-containing protein [Sandaracinaceae bacterium]